MKREAIVINAFVNESLSDHLFESKIEKYRDVWFSILARYKKNNIFKSAQSCRNALSKCEKKKLIIKEGKNKKIIKLNSNMNVQTEDTILLDYKILSIFSLPICVKPDTPKLI